MLSEKDLVGYLNNIGQLLASISKNTNRSDGAVVAALETINQNIIASSNNATHLNRTNIACINQLRLDLILREPGLSGELRLERHGFQVFSQNEEDGIIAAIFQRIGTGTRVFVEFGAGNGVENNSIYLLMQGWSGLWIEGSPDNARSLSSNFQKQIQDGTLKIANKFIDKDNINQIISENGISGEIDLLSIDIDGNDYHVFDAIDVIKPRVVVAEYNAKFPPPVRWTMPYNPAHAWDGTFYYGASLSALEDLYRRKGYSLVGCSVTGINVFFVRSDLAVGKFEEPFTAEHHYHPPRLSLGTAFKGGQPPSLRAFTEQQFPLPEHRTEPLTDDAPADGA